MLSKRNWLRSCNVTVLLSPRISFFFIGGKAKSPYHNIKKKSTCWILTGTTFHTDFLQYKKIVIIDWVNFNRHGGSGLMAVPKGGRMPWDPNWVRQHWNQVSSILDYGHAYSTLTPTHGKQQSWGVCYGTSTWSPIAHCCIPARVILIFNLPNSLGEKISNATGVSLSRHSQKLLFQPTVIIF